MSYGVTVKNVPRLGESMLDSRTRTIPQTSQTTLMPIQTRDCGMGSELTFPVNRTRPLGSLKDHASHIKTRGDRIRCLKIYPYTKEVDLLTKHTDLSCLPRRLEMVAPGISGPCSE